MMNNQEFSKLLDELGIDDQHDDYDDLWSDYLFGGKDPNALVEKYRSEFRNSLETPEPTQLPPYDMFYEEHKK